MAKDVVFKPVDGSNPSETGCYGNNYNVLIIHEWLDQCTYNLWKLTKLN